MSVFPLLIICSSSLTSIAGAAAGGQSTFLVLVNGSVKYEKNLVKVFSQTFILTAVSGTWKIVSDTYRTSD